MSNHDASTPNASSFSIRGDTINLGQLLKALGIVSSGAQVKELLLESVVQVNGETETRRGRKVHPGDVITLPANVLVKICSSD